MAQTPAPFEYILKRDHLAATRLNYLHFLTKTQLGFSLHPSIPVSPDQALRIADIGCGTCIFAIELANQLPASKIDAFDISPDQFPPSAWLPPNVTTHVQDAFAPFPEQFHGAFDVVAIRYFITIVPGQPKGLLDNLAKLLKPGGYLQWVDSNPTTFRAESANPDLECSATKWMISFLTKPEYSWSNKLNEYFSASGLTPITNPPIIHNRAGRESWSWWMQMSLMAVDEVIERGASSMGKEQRDELVSKSNEMKREAEHGVAFLVDLVVVVGQLDQT